MIWNLRPIKRINHPRVDNHRIHHQCAQLHGPIITGQQPNGWVLIPQCPAGYHITNNPRRGVERSQNPMTTELPTMTAFWSGGGIILQWLKQRLSLIGIIH